MHTQRVAGVVSQGYRIASGLNTEGIPGPGGTTLKDSFVRQRPFFEAQIPDFSYVWTGTINVNIEPKVCTMLGFDYQITCEWHPGISETFGIVRGITLIRGDKEYPGFIYYPMPSDIHIPRNTIIEVLAQKIDGLAYGEKVTLIIPNDKVSIQ